MYEELKLEHIQETLRALQRRIAERFPESGLSKVAAELVKIGDETGPIIQGIRRPHRGLKAAVTAAITLIAALTLGLLVYVGTLRFNAVDLAIVLQAVESAAQDVIFFAVAVYFLLTLESRLDRKVSLRELHRLRTIVHIVDMHQLTKDPDHLLHPDSTSTPSSPVRKFNHFELSRYLDYCSEMLSLTSKLAALHVQYVNDPVVLSAVSDIEVLASNLSNKIWQKIIVIDAARSPMPT